MIYHQSPYGHIIKMSTTYYYSLSDLQLKTIEERYLNTNMYIISYSGESFSEVDEIIDQRQERDFYFDFGDE